MKKTNDQLLKMYRRNLKALQRERALVAKIEVEQECREHARKLELVRASAPKFIVKVYG